MFNIIFFLLLSSVSILIFYHLYFGLRQSSYINAPHCDHPSKKVSVIIAAKNEESNLKKNLPLILNQKYPVFEVIVIDDQSQDNTKEILQECITAYPNLVLIHNSLNEKGGKKIALRKGILKAKYDTLLFTDADCTPNSTYWIQYMTQYTNPNTISLGCSFYEKEKSFLNQIIQADTLHTALMYTSFAQNKQTYMGVGRNLSYSKTLFLQHNGFKPHDNIPFGDDDIFINKISKHVKSHILLYPDSQTNSKPKKNFREYFKQKTRHAKAFKYYTNKTLILKIYYTAQSLFTVSSILAIITITLTQADLRHVVSILFLILIKTGVQYYRVKIFIHNTKYGLSVVRYLFLEYIFSALNFIFSLYSVLFAKVYKTWK